MSGRVNFKLRVLMAALVVLVVIGTAFAQDKRANDASRRASKAANIVKSLMSKPDSAIPSKLLDKAEAVIVCPEVSRAALGIGGSNGQCVISRRTEKGWSTPAFYNISGGSIGAQIGVSKSDYIFLVMNEDGVNSLLSDKFQIGGEAGAVAGPYGRTASANTDATLNAGILSYASSKGAYIGAAIKGSAITPDNDLNEAFYGQKAAAILGVNNGITMTKMMRGVSVYPTMLARYSARKR